MGDAFQQFVHDIFLPDYPDLHRFPTAGKDGGIDISFTLHSQRTIFECKYIGEDGKETAQKRWKEVEKNLLNNRSNPEKPPQKQYAPWFTKDPIIAEYVFCVSSRIGNQENFDSLKEKIQEFFRETSKDSRLSHLENIRVRVADWGEFDNRLKKQPALLLRWFPKTRPLGLIPLDDIPEFTNFRAYLRCNKLPYYRLSDHKKLFQSSQETEIHDEEGLLQILESGTSTGLIITGGGGVGKSRLTLELGFLAQQKGWVVLRSEKRISEEELKKLAENLNADTKALLLFDYIETRNDFSEILDVIQNLNDTYHLCIRYIANCRPNFYFHYTRSQGMDLRHYLVDLSPMQGSAKEWLDGYRKETVHHILNQSGLDYAYEKLAPTQKIPIFAVFASYVYAKKQDKQSCNVELSEMLNEENFSNWIIKRVQLSFLGKKDLLPELGLLAALFPMPKANCGKLAQDLRKMLEVLSNDCWIEEFISEDGEETMAFTHDVLADQILTSSVPPRMVDLFLGQLLEGACQARCLRSAIQSLQRVAGNPPFDQAKWSRIISTSIGNHKDTWEEVRLDLLRLSLLDPEEKISLLECYQPLWEGAEKELGFHFSLVSIICWILPFKRFWFFRHSFPVYSMEEALWAGKVFVLLRMALIGYGFKNQGKREW